MLSLFKRKSADLDSLFHEGLALYQKGANAEACKQFAAILAQDPNHVGAHHLRGYALLRENKPKEALAHLRFAFAADPTDAELAISLGRVLLEFRASADALACYEAVPEDVRTATLWRDHGALLADYGRHADAERALKASLALDPDDPATWTIVGRTHRIRGNLTDAENALQSALRFDPAWVEALCQLAFLRQIRGDLEGAVELLERAQTSQPNNGEVAGQLADALRLLGRREQAELQLKNALKLHEDEIKITSGSPALWNSYGLLLKNGGNIKSAIYAFNCALDLDPNYRQAINNLATLFSDIRDLDAAEAAFERAIAIKPTQPETYTNLGAVKYWRGQTREAIALYEKAAALGVDNGELAFNWSLALLLTGDYERGFRLYERRFETVPFRGRGGSHFLAPRWQGEDLSGKRLIVWHEQGLGDVLQCARYVPLLEKRGAEVVLYAHASLVQVFRASFNCEVMAGESAPPDGDYHCPVFSLPHAFGTTATTVPWLGPYITARDEWIETWRTRVDVTGRPKVGIVWAGNPNHINDSNRSMKFADLAPWIAEQRIAWHSLQKGPAALASERTDIANIATHFDDFSDTAGAIANLDLVIAVDTSVAHLAAAMGRPTWLLLPAAPDWRWFENRADSPWYPSVRVFRQQNAGDWSTVQHEVAQALDQFIRMLNGKRTP